MAAPTSANNQSPRPKSPLVPPDLRPWQWAAGGVSGILITVAIVLWSTDPSLTYEPAGVGGVDVTVECTSSGDVVDYPSLDGPMTTHYEITSGEAAFDAWEESQDDLALGTASGSDLATEKNINADCLRAEIARLHTTNWLLAGGVTLGIAFVWLFRHHRRRQAALRTGERQRSA